MIGIIFAGLLAGASVSDIRLFKVSDKYWMFIFALSVWNYLKNSQNDFSSYAAGFFVVSVPLCIITLMLTRAFGGADIKMMAVCGAYLGMKTIVMSFVLGMFLAALFCVLTHVIKRRQIGHIPLVPFLSIGIAVVVFFVI